MRRHWPRWLSCALALAPAGCVALPPLPVDRSPPHLAAAPPPHAGEGQVVVDAEGVKTARLDEIVGHAKIRSDTSAISMIGGTWVAVPYSTTTDVAITRERCSALPCTMSAPLGETELAVTSGEESQPFRLSVETTPTFVRIRLPEHHRPPLAVLGWVLASVSLAPLAAGASMLAVDSSELLAPGVASLGGGVLVAVLGLVLAATNPITSRPGSVLSWTLPP